MSILNVKLATGSMASAQETAWLVQFLDDALLFLNQKEQVVQMLWSNLAGEMDRASVSLKEL